MTKILLVRSYKKLLEVEILKNPMPLRILSALADPFMGNRMVMYLASTSLDKPFKKPHRNEHSVRRLFRRARDAIRIFKNKDGSIPWFKNGVIDPWNHLEAAMG